MQMTAGQQQQRQAPVSLGPVNQAYLAALKAESGRVDGAENEHAARLVNDGKN